MLTGFLPKKPLSSQRRAEGWHLCSRATCAFSLCPIVEQWTGGHPPALTMPFSLQLYLDQFDAVCERKFGRSYDLAGWARATYGLALGRLHKDY